MRNCLAALGATLVTASIAWCSTTPTADAAPSLRLEAAEGVIHARVEAPPGAAAPGEFARLVALPPGATNARLGTGASVAADAVTLGEPMILRGTPVLPVTVRTGDGSLEFDILYDAPAGKAPSKAAGHSRGFYDAYGKLLGYPEGHPIGTGPEGSFVIVTDQEFLAVLEPFVRWKREMGYDVTVVTTAQTGPQSGDIQSYLRDLYQNSDNPPQYVLLFGDVAQIPGWVFDQSISDHPYAMLDGDDFLPDVEVGRVPAGNTNEATTLVAKLLAYEKTPYMTQTDWYTHGLVVGGNEGSTTPLPVSRWCRDQLFGMGFTAVDSVYDPPYGAAGRVLIKNKVSAGVSIVTYRGWARSWEGWESPLFSYTDVPSVTNGRMLPLVCSFVCQNNNFAERECFGEAWVRAGTAEAPKGGIAFIGNSEHWSHTRHNDAAAIGAFHALKSYGVRRFAQILAASKAEIYASFPDQVDHDTWGDVSVEFYYYIYNLLGDPSMELWTAPPESVAVSHADTIALGSSYYWVEVLDGHSGDEIVGARVGLSQAGVTLASAFTDTDGQARFAVPFVDDSAPVTVTVTGRGLYPYQDSVEVVSRRPHLGLAGVSIKDDGTGRSVGNGDGVVNPGETIEVFATLSNNNASGATGVTGFLMPDGWGYAVEPASIPFPDVPAGGTTRSDTAWVVTIDDDARDGLTAWFVLQAFTGGTQTQSGFSLGVEAPDLRYASHAFDGDGILDPGETSAITLSLVNDGAANAPATTAILRSVDQDLAVVIDSVANLGTIASGASGSPATAFTVAAADSAGVGRAAGFTLTLTTAAGYVMTTTFAVTVGDVDLRAPLGPDAYGYYAYDSADNDYPDAAPVFDWVECSTAYGGVGTDLDMTDESDPLHPERSLAIVSLPFPFKFYGKTYANLMISNNGWASFHTERFYDFYNWNLPSAYGSGALIAPFWDNLDPGSTYGGAPLADGVYVWSDAANHRYVVEWSRIPNVRPYHGNRTDYDDLETFELILYDPAYHPTTTGDGRIRFQYKQVVNYDTERMYATVGIENEDEDDGLQYSYTNMYPEAAAPLSSGLAIEFRTDPPRYDPFQLAAFRAEADARGVRLSWEPGDDRARGATIVYREGAGGAYEPLPGGVLPSEARGFVDETADPGSAASYKIGSLDPVGHETLLGPFAYEGRAAAAIEFALDASGPNPTRGGSLLRYALPERSLVRLRIFSVSGRLVRTLVDGEVAPGRWSAEWDGRDDRGRELPSGVYFGRLEAGAGRRNVKLTLLR